ncbi:MAG: family 10 glycosylhydrolase [Planctomycetota bacterium]
MTPRRLVAALLVLALGSAPWVPAQEVRGVWIARDGLTSKRKISQSLDAARAANLNVVCVNVWSRGYTLHPSAVMQRVAGVAQDPGFVGRDPLQETIVEAHRRGMEVEAWLEYGFCAGWSGHYPGPGGRGPVLNAHPSWTAVDASGSTSVTDANGTFYWLAHENPDARAFLLDLVDELVDRYDIDGVQLDRIRYPSTAFGYDPATVSAYRAANGNRNPPSNGTNSGWMRWRADALSTFVADARARVQARRYTVRTTCAPIAMDTAYNSFLQDWPAWVRDGDLDFCYPQIYRTTLSSYVSTLDANLARVPSVFRSRIIPGVRAVTGTSTADVLGMVQANRQRGLQGHVFWYLEGLYDDLPALTAGPFATPATVPGHGASWRPAPTVIEENAPTVVTSGPWTTETTFYASAGAQRKAPVGQGAFAEIPFTPAAPGLFSLQVHLGYTPGASSGIACEVTHGGGTSVYRLPRVGIAESGFHHVGTFWLDPAQGPARVRIDDRNVLPGGTFTVDAVQWMPTRFRSGPIEAFGQAAGLALGVAGVATTGGRTEAHIGGLAPFTTSLCVVGLGRTNIPIGPASLRTTPIGSLFVGGDGYGAATLPVTFPADPNLLGQDVVLQAFAQQGGGIAGSPAVEIRLR